MCFDICTINIRVSIRVRGLHLILFIHIDIDPSVLEVACDFGGT